MKHTEFRDLYAENTARIVAALEQGTAPWVKPWSTGIDTLPMNGVTRRPYRGVNVLLLELEATAHGYPLQRWLTYRQAQELGGHVRPGEHGTTVVFWHLRELEAKGEASQAEPKARVVPLLRAHTVFNVAQVDGLPASVCATEHPRWDAEAQAEGLLASSGARIQHGGSKAYYQPGIDAIQLPPRQAFATAGNYYATALHELAHWTAHPARCHRDLSGRFGDDAYAAEELIAEMGSAFLCAHCRIDGQLQHASYLSSWLRVLRADKRAIFVASTKAQQAADFVLSLAQRPVEEAALAA
jgi:antirestriction protein ArdC